MAKNSGPQYALDRADRHSPFRGINAWAVGHPLLNAISFVLVAVVFGGAAYAYTNSWIVAVVVAVSGTAAAVLRVRANHQRRLANGTSAVYGPPRD